MAAGGVLDVVGRVLGRGQPDRHRHVDSDHGSDGEHRDRPGQPTGRHGHARLGRPATTSARTSASELECSTLAVPLDYDDPDGATIDIALARVPANDPGRPHRIARVQPGRARRIGDRLPVVGRAWLVPAEARPNGSTSSGSTREASGRAPRSTATSKIDDNIVLLEAGDDDGWNALLDEANGLADTCPADRHSTWRPYVGTNNAAQGSRPRSERHSATTN